MPCGHRERQGPGSTLLRAAAVTGTHLLMREVPVLQGHPALNTCSQANICPPPRLHPASLLPSLPRFLEELSGPSMAFPLPRPRLESGFCSHFSTDAAFFKDTSHHFPVPNSRGRFSVLIFIHSFHSYFLRGYFVPSSVLDSGDTAMNKTLSRALMDLSP